MGLQHTASREGGTKADSTSKCHTEKLLPCLSLAGPRAVRGELIEVLDVTKKPERPPKLDALLTCAGTQASPKLQCEKEFRAQWEYCCKLSSKRFCFWNPTTIKGTTLYMEDTALCKARSSRTISSLS
eukprot:6465076-Amphidinium_carterae.1